MSTDTPSPIMFRWYISVAVVLLIFAAIGVLSLRVARNTSSYDDDQARLRYQKLATMREQESKTLNNADWVDKDKGVVRIPIDEAMAQEIGLLQNDKPRAGAAIPGAAAPATVSDNDASTTNPNK